MTRQDIIDKIERGGGTWIAKGGMKFTIESKDQTIWARWSKGLKSGIVYEYTAFQLAMSRDNFGSMHLSQMGNIEDIGPLNEFVGLLSKNIGIELQGPHSIIVVEDTKTEPQADTKEQGTMFSGMSPEDVGVLRGKVEAFEGIVNGLLIGRELTVGK